MDPVHDLDEGRRRSVVALNPLRTLEPQIEEVLLLRLRQPKGARKPEQRGLRRMNVTGLLERRVPGRTHTSERCELFAADARAQSPAFCTQSYGGWRQPPPPRSQE